MAMTRSQRVAAAAAIATAVAAPAEGLRQVAYRDPPGILTVCRGHTGPDVVPGKKYSLAECDQFMTDDMRKAVDTVERCQPGLPVEVLASFADAAFNAGPTIACDTKKSTAARMLKAGDLVGACNQHARWNKSRIAGVMVELPGLTKRTLERKALCLKGIV
jgi:GH24 family phage-related lysozyme (muramidase)